MAENSQKKVLVPNCKPAPNLVLLISETKHLRQLFMEEKCIVSLFYKGSVKIYKKNCSLRVDSHFPKIDQLDCYPKARLWFLESSGLDTQYFNILDLLNFDV